MIEDVLWGCVSQVGEQAFNIGRNSALAAGFPESVVGTTIDRQCGSSQQAVHFAAAGLVAGHYDVVVAGGVESMSRVPMFSSAVGGEGPFPPLMLERYDNGLVNQGVSAEMIAAKWQISREAMEAFALASHQRAQAATQAGWFAGEISALEGLEVDETIRAGTTMEGLAALKPVQEGGTITAGIASQNCDGAAALLIASERAVREHNLTPRARVHHISVRADDPVWMLTAPIPATQHALKKAGMTIADIDLFECNEAFASVPLAWMKELGIPHEKVNVNGGGIALGHPLGATGARLMTTLLNALERTGGRYGLQTMCEGGGQANVTIIERL